MGVDARTCTRPPACYFLPNLLESAHSRHRFETSWRSGAKQMPTPARVVVAPAEARGALRVEDVELPDPTGHLVVVKQFASGVCHSQLHQMHRDKPGPVVLGHESTGVVTAIGPDVDHLKVGDTVMVTW